MSGVSLAVMTITICSVQPMSTTAEQTPARDVMLECDLGVGSGSAEILTTDLSPEYVHLNAEYEGDA